MKRILALMTSLVLVLTLLSGCTPDELKLMELNTQVNNLDAYTATGSMHWSLNLMELLGDNSDSKDAALIKTVQDTLTKEGLQDLTYTYAVNMNPLAMDAQYFTASGKPLMAVKLIGNMYYVNLDGVIAILEAQNNPELKKDASYQAFVGIKGKYLAVSLDELTGDASGLTFGAEYQKSLAAQVKLRKLMTDNFLSFVKTELKGYNPGIVTKTFNSTKGADSYGYTLKAEDVPQMTLELALYLTDHIDGLKTLVTGIVKAPEFKEISGTTEDPDQMVKDVETSFDEMKANLETMKTQVAAALKEEKEKGTYRAQAEMYLKGTEFSTHTAQLKDGRFWTDATLKLRMNIPSVPLKTADLTVDMTITPKTSVSITAPADVIPFKVLNDSLPHSVDYQVDDKSFSYTPGMMGTEYGDADMYITTGGKTYMALGSIPEHFRAKAFTSINPLKVKDRVLVAGTDYTAKGDVRYVAVSVLKEAGLTITWDEEERTITIED